jgi:cystathionine beta-synthase/cysteine synthase A
MVLGSILEATGRTPLVRVRRLKPNNGSDIVLKLEGFNPAGSLKDRAALRIIDEAERSGDLEPGGTIIEATSGNFGKALALIGASRGYRVVLVMDPRAPSSATAYCRALGAEVVMVTKPDEQGGYQRPRLEMAMKLAKSTPGSFWPNQYSNPWNARAHADTTARELLEDLTGADALVASVSTGGHLSGIAQMLRTAFPNLVVVAVDAQGSAAFGKRSSPYLIRGMGLGWKPGNLNMDVVDFLQVVADDEAIETCRVTAKEEGLLLGESGGAVLFAALSLALRRPQTRIVGVAADDGAAYLAETYDDGWVVKNAPSVNPTRVLNDLVERAARPTYALQKLQRSGAHADEMAVRYVEANGPAW